MSHAASGEGLLYSASPGDKSVYIYNFLTGQPAGTLTGLKTPVALCSDAHGNVWVGDWLGDSKDPGQLIKFAHGGTSPLEKLPNNSAPIDCGVDPTTGNLAVVAPDYESPYGDLVIYNDGKGKPHYYRTRVEAESCTYDSRGNLFVTGGLNTYSAGIDWLKKGSAKFVKFRLSPFAYPHYGVRWDGHHHLVVARSPDDFYQYAVKHGIGEQLRNFRLSRGGVRVSLFWIAGSTLVGSNDGYSSDDEVDYWRYPGGKLRKRIIVSTSRAGVTVSRAGRTEPRRTNPGVALQ